MFGIRNDMVDEIKDDTKEEDRMINIECQMHWY